MTIEERLEQAEKLVAEVKAELAAMRATKPRNWPERIEAGMVFKAKFTGATWMATGRGTECMCIANGKHGGWGVMNDVSDALDYLGHARDILTIRTDAHEPTGAELVGKVCQVSEDGIGWRGPWTLESYWEGKGWSWGSHDTWYKFARLAK